MQLNKQTFQLMSKITEKKECVTVVGFVVGEVEGAVVVAVAPPPPVVELRPTARTSLPFA